MFETTVSTNYTEYTDSSTMTCKILQEILSKNNP